MTERFLALALELRAALTGIAQKSDVPKAIPLTQWLDAILEDDGHVLSLIEDFADASWVVGKYDGHYEGLKAAQAFILEQAAKAFVARNDDAAAWLRDIAEKLGEQVTTAISVAQKQRAQRGYTR